MLPLCEIVQISPKYLDIRYSLGSLAANIYIMCVVLRLSIVGLSISLIAFTLGGCAIGEGIGYYTTQAGTGYFDGKVKQKQLQRVARDWCLTIRASQVIPVYPLDEDVQVGDLYIVDTPISQLKRQWNQKGYLPIDHRFGRIHPSGYNKYYLEGQYDVPNRNKAPLPKLWQFPKGSGSAAIPKSILTTLMNARETLAEKKQALLDATEAAALAQEKVASLPAEADQATKDKAAGELAAAKAKVGPAGTAVEKARTALNNAQTARDKAADDIFKATNWPLAPRAGFPSYTVKVKSGQGFAGAIPVSGVPIALSAMGAREANISVTLSDAYTYGIDESSLLQDLRAWESTNRDFLKAYGPPTQAGGNNRGAVAVRDPGGDSAKNSLATYNLDLRKGTTKAKRRCNPATKKNDRRYLRVITRVYLVRSVDVAVTNASSAAWRGSVGEPKPLENIPSTITADTDLTRLLAKQDLETGGTNGTASVETTPAVPSGNDGQTTMEELDAREAALNERAKNPDLTDEQRINLAEERKLLADERKLQLEKKKHDLDRRRAAFNQTKQKQQADDRAIARALNRTESTDRFGGYVVPGGSIQVTSATSRSVTMKERFPRPLVVGYHALEFEIGPGGILSTRPTSTFQRMEFGQSPSTPIEVEETPEMIALADFLQKSKNKKIVRQWLKSKGYDISLTLFTVMDKYKPLRDQFFKENKEKYNLMK